METETEAPHRHRIMLALKPEGPFVCSCGLVLWSSEEAMHHLAENDERLAA